nr:MAG TPA: hypothetical protein [Caudoviricetes sp.]
MLVIYYSICFHYVILVTAIWGCGLLILCGWYWLIIELFRSGWYALAWSVRGVH